MLSHEWSVSRLLDIVGLPCHKEPALSHQDIFSPVAAVVCSVLPGLIFFSGAFILWDIAWRQQKLLDKLGIQYKPVSKRDLVILFVFVILSCIVFDNTKAVLTWPGCFAACATFIGIMVSCLRVLRPCVEQGNMLYQLLQKEIIHAKLEDSTLYT